MQSMEKTKANKPTGFILETKELSSISGVLRTLAAFFIVLFGFRLIAKDLIAPIIMSLFLTILLTPIFRWFRRRGFSSGVSLFLMIVSFIVSAVFLVTFFTWAMGNLRESLSVYVTSFKESVGLAAESVGINKESVNNALQNLSPDTIVQIFTLIINSFSNIFIYLFFVPFLAFLFLIQFDSMSSMAKDGLVKDNPRLAKFQYFAESIMVYVIGRAKTNLWIAIPFTLVLLLLGIQSAFVWGFLTFILCFVPYVGLILAAIPPTFLALAQYGSFQAFLVIATMGILIILSENLVAPMIQGRGNKLSTATVVISFIFWLWIFGAVGGILAIPLTVLLKIILEDYKETAWIASLMEGNYAATPKNKRSYLSKIKGIWPGSGK